MYCSPHLCVGFLFLVAHSRPYRLLPPPHSHTTYYSQLTHTHTQLSHTHTTYSHTQLSHTLPSHTQLPHTQLTHTHTNYSHTHNLLTHTTYSHTHITYSHTTPSHTTPSHTHNSLTHNSLRHNSLTHNLLTHNLLTHTQFTHNLLLTTHSHTHNSLTHNRSDATQSAILRGRSGTRWQRCCLLISYAIWHLVALSSSMQARACLLFLDLLQTWSDGWLVSRRCFRRSSDVYLAFGMKQLMLWFRVCHNLVHPQLGSSQLFFHLQPHGLVLWAWV